jgi:2-haloacid dehalogenase
LHGDLVTLIGDGLYTWLLFDADDTLFDYPQAEAKALGWTFEEMGLEYGPEVLPVYHRFNRQVWQEFEQGTLTAVNLRTKRFALLFAELALTVDPETFSPRYLKNLARGSDLLPGAEETLRALASDFHIAVVTNGLGDVQRSRLEHSPIKPYIEKLFISEELGAVKPEKAFFDHVFAQIGQPEKQEVLIIGDSLTSDMLGGVRYGLDTCWFNPLGKVTDLAVTSEIKKLEELTSLLRIPKHKGHYGAQRKNKDYR